MSDAKKGADKKKDKGKAKGKGKAAPEAKPDAVLMSVAAHPRAAASVRRAKGWGGLLAFAATAYLSLSHGVSADVAGLRALAAGLAGYLVAWACAVMVWRQLMVAELRARVERARQRVAPPAPAPSSEPPKS